MFDHLTRLHERSAERTRSGVVFSLLLHALVLAGIFYMNERVREAVIAGERRSDASWSGEAPIRIPSGSEADPALDLPEPASPADVVLPGIRLPRSLLREAGIPSLDANLPDTLELGRPQTVRLALPPNRLPEDSVVRVQGVDGVGMSPVSISRARQATVHGENLIIQPKSPPLQLTDSARRTEWHWTLIPTQPGLQTLYLQLDAPATVEGKPHIVTLGRVRQEIVVEATPLQRVSRFFSRNWTFFLLVTVAALISWARARWRVTRVRADPLASRR